MFFILSKIIFPFLSPLVWAFGLFVFSFFSKKHAQKFRISAVLVLFVFSNLFLFEKVLKAWEVEPITVSENEVYSYGIVLTGMTNYSNNYNRAYFNRSVNRITDAIRLYNAGKIKKLLITGGSGRVFDTDFKESVFLRDFLLTIGIPKKDIIIEPESRNTAENAIYTAEILKTKKYDKLLLITSAFHMRRSEACFKKAGLETTSYSTDFYDQKHNVEFSKIIFPDPDALFGWHLLIKEWVGFISYKVRGYA